MPLAKVRQIVDQICQLLKDGFDVDDETWRFINNMLPDPTPAEVAFLMQDVDDSESATIADLLFFPSESMQTKLEPYIGSGRLTVEELRSLTAHLKALELETSIHFKAFQKSLSIKIPSFAVARFVDRLHLDYQLPAEVTAVIDRRLSNSDGIQAKVRLRNTHQSFQAHQVELLIYFFNRFSSDRSEFWPCFEFFQTILPESPPFAAFFNFLIKKKKFYFQAVIRAEQFLSKLQRINPETLIMRGERVAFIHPDEGRRLMGNIDVICRALFGRGEYLQFPIADDTQLDEHDPKRNLSKLIDYFS